MNKFKLHQPWPPAGDQPAAIEELVSGLKDKKEDQVLLGVTGSGKTYTMANVIAAVNKPTLVIAHNKTLTAQLASEFREFFPDNAVDYFVSFYDYYQPEAYLPSTDTYIEKDSMINEEIEKYRHKATHDLLIRSDVIIVASVSCIYGLGSPEEYKSMAVSIATGQQRTRNEVLLDLIRIQYQRNDTKFTRGTFRVKGDVIDVWPSFAEAAYRVEMFGDDIERITEFDPLTGEHFGSVEKILVFPAKHAVTTMEKIEKITPLIRSDLELRYAELKAQGNEVAAARLKQRTEYDLEMLEETGYCTGIENYSRYLSGRAEGEPPYTLMDFFPDDFLLIVDEAHMTIPQVGGMYEGDRSRKTTLIEYGFRLPSALDNRPLKFPEFEKRKQQAIYVSATPGKYELEKTQGEVVEQVIRPTGLLDPQITVRPTKDQIDDLLGEIVTVVSNNERVLITTLTKKMAEDLTDYLLEAGQKVRYLHSDIDTLERIEILRSLRLGEIDIVVGINLLREGLDLPEVSLVAILDADKQGFLRSRDALIQTIGRASRNDHGRVLMYADKISEAMEGAMAETARRRTKQEEYNKKHGIVPKTIIKEVKDIGVRGETEEVVDDLLEKVAVENIPLMLKRLEDQMMIAAENLEFEEAAQLRDQMVVLEERLDKEGK